MAISLTVRLLVGLCMTAALTAQATTFVVGPNGAQMSFAQALADARDGDTIDLLAGEYRGEVATITQRKLLLRGVGGRPVFIAEGKAAEDKAIWVVRDGDITVENVEFRGARVADVNGAGIRFEKGHLTVRRCTFFDNEMGIITANDPDAQLTIEDSEFGRAPHTVGGLLHLLYVGRIARLDITGSRFHLGFEGHLIKSRAKVSRIAYNLIYDGVGGEASYEIDLPSGGDATLIGNIIGQSRGTQNPVVVSYGAEGKAWDVNHLLMSHNTLISDYPVAWFLRAWPDKLGPDTKIRAINNLTVGLGIFTWGASGDFDGNYPAFKSMLAAPDALGFELPSSSILRGRDDDPRVLGGEAAVPKSEFVFPIGTRPLTPPAEWSPGALQRQ